MTSRRPAAGATSGSSLQDRQEVSEISLWTEIVDLLRIRSNPLVLAYQGQIVAEASRRFREGEEPAAVAFAAALGWQAGRATAGECAGYAPTGHDEPAARAMREGRGDVRFVLDS